MKQQVVVRTTAWEERIGRGVSEKLLRGIPIRKVCLDPRRAGLSDSDCIFHRWHDRGETNYQIVELLKKEGKAEIGWIIDRDIEDLKSAVPGVKTIREAFEYMVSNRDDRTLFGPALESVYNKAYKPSCINGNRPISAAPIYAWVGIDLTKPNPYFMVRDLQYAEDSGASCTVGKKELRRFNKLGLI